MENSGHAKRRTLTEGSNTSRLAGGCTPDKTRRSRPIAKTRDQDSRGQHRHKGKAIATTATTITAAIAEDEYEGGGAVRTTDRPTYNIVRVKSL